MYFKCYVLCTWFHHVAYIICTNPALAAIIIQSVSSIKKKNPEITFHCCLKTDTETAKLPKTADLSQFGGSCNLDL